MTREQWVERMKRVLAALNQEVGLVVLEKGDALGLNAESAVLMVGGYRVSLLYGYDLHSGRSDQFWVEFGWQGEHGFETHVLSERDLMCPSKEVALEVLDAITW